MRVYYEDTDFTGIVYHGAYVRFFERGRSDFLRLIGVHHAELAAMEPPLAFAITKLNLRYMRPARIDDALYVRTTWERMRGARLDSHQRIERATTGGSFELIAEADVFAASITMDGRPRRPPPEVVEKLVPLGPQAWGMEPALAFR